MAKRRTSIQRQLLSILSSTTRLSDEGCRAELQEIEGGGAIEQSMNSLDPGGRSWEN
jgi:hypothetical protein